MTYPHAKVQGQRPVGSEDRVETCGWTEASALRPTLLRSVIKQHSRHMDYTAMVSMLLKPIPVYYYAASYMHSI